MTRREAVWAAAYGSAFAEELARGCHGHTFHVWEAEGGYRGETIDATARAKAWATTCADAAVASLEDCQ